MNRENTAKAESRITDPRKRFASPPFPQPKQDAPGSSNDLQPQADYGESTYTGSGKLAGRAALITGADSGIGRAVALCFAKEGADVLFAHLPEEADDAKETVRLVEAAGRKAIAMPGDIQTKSFCEQLVEETLRTFGRLDVLVNNAAFQRTHEKLEEISEDEFDTTFRTNVYATFFLTQAALPKMNPGGVVLNTCSIEAYQPAESLVVYAATKSALVSLTKSFAKLAIKSGVRVNGVAPGPV
jgi:NAD(P)-dependent dehydrogenase (short-subunit alcohol dehydrogenase family)